MIRSGPVFSRDVLRPLRKVRSALTSLRSRSPQGTPAPEADGPPAAAPDEPRPSRLWSASCWRVCDHADAIFLTVCVLGAGILLAHYLAVGGSEQDDWFDVGNLWIRYGMRSRDLLGDRLAYAVIAPASPNDQEYDEATNTYTFVFPGNHPVTVRPEPGETLWIDGQYHVVSLGQALQASDIEKLAVLRCRGRPPITSVEQFLAFLAQVRAGPTAPGGQPSVP